MNPQRIPQELRDRAQWICWRWRQLPNGNMTKPPCSAHTGEVSDVNNRAAWGTFAQASDTAQRLGLPGVGYANASDDPYTIIDLDDHPHNPISEDTRAKHHAILQHFDSYTERSVSGRGYHVIVRGKVPTKATHDSVDLYGASGSYVVCTGDVVRDLPIADYSADILRLYQQMQAAKPNGNAERNDELQTLSDDELIARAVNAVNGEKFVSLCRGWDGPTLEYPSQSHADLALMSMLAFYSRNDEQCKRIFRLTELGKRDKATKNDYYLNRNMQRIRNNELPAVNLDIAASIAAQLATYEADTIPSPPALIPPPPPPPLLLSTESEPTDDDIDAPSPYTFPPGLVGDIAQYIHDSARRPNTEVALCAAIAAMAGVAARTYNISGSGLNQYIMVVATTGVGKEDGTKGIERLYGSASMSIPMVASFQGPAAFGSGQAIISSLNEQPCFVSIINEIGDKIKTWLDPRAPGPVALIKSVLLDLFNKSGPGDYLRPTAYSDRSKNTASIQAPNLTMYGDTAPDKFFKHISIEDIADGFLSRLVIVESKSKRALSMNEGAGFAPSAELAGRFAELCQVALASRHNQTFVKIATDSDAKRLLKTFDVECSRAIRSSFNEGEAELWTRAHFKALRLAGLVAVGLDLHAPTVTADVARWAIEFSRMTTAALLKRFTDDDVGQGDTKQRADLRKIVKEYFAAPSSKLTTLGVNLDMRQQGIVPFRYVLYRAGKFASFYGDRNGCSKALQWALQSAVDTGDLLLVSPQVAHERFKARQKLYAIGETFRL